MSGLANIQTRISMKTEVPASNYLNASKDIAPTQLLQGAGDFWARLEEGLLRGHTFFADQKGKEVEILLNLIAKKWSK